MQIRRLAHLVALAVIGAIVGADALAQTNSSSGSAAVSQQPGDKNLQSAAETPLRNANLVKQEIPPVLTAAMANPYARPRVVSCRVITSDVAALTSALGPDFDAGAGGDKSALAPSAVRVAANTFIPFQGLVRYVSGAEAHDRQVVRAIIAGSARRSYLKGLGEARGCTAPAAPKRADPPAATHIRKR
jgi:hypothetical protein